MQGRAVFPVGNRNPGIGGYCGGSADSRDNFKGNPMLCQQFQFFPSAAEADYPNRYAALLYDCASPMPALFDEAIREAKGPGAVPPFRGMSFNASAAQLVAMLNIGSISVKTE